jgi:hypothetical protein
MFTDILNRGIYHNGFQELQQGVVDELLVFGSSRCYWRVSRRLSTCVGGSLFTLGW